MMKILERLKKEFNRYYELCKTEAVELTGTEKQVKWAKDIKIKVAESLKNKITEIEEESKEDIERANKSLGDMEKGKNYFAYAGEEYLGWSNKDGGIVKMVAERTESVFEYEEVTQEEVDRRINTINILTERKITKLTIMLAELSAETSAKIIIEDYKNWR